MTGFMMSWRRFWRVWNKSCASSFTLFHFLLNGLRRLACRLPPKALFVSPEKILASLDAQAQPILKAMDDFAGDIEACYDAL